MTAPVLRCDRCQTPLPEAVLNTPAPVPCPGCHAPLLARVFPAFTRGDGIAPGRAAESVGSDEDASCFFHPRKKAVVPCARCGRFLCALCDVEIGGRHFCPACVADPAAGNPGYAVSGTMFANERTLYDRVALTLAVWPLIVWPLTLFGAPMAFYFAVRYWNSPKQGLIRRSRYRLVMAASIALVEMAGWVTLGYYAFVAHTRVPF